MYVAVSYYKNGLASTKHANNDADIEDGVAVSKASPASSADMYKAGTSLASIVLSQHKSSYCSPHLGSESLERGSGDGKETSSPGLANGR